MKQVRPSLQANSFANWPEFLITCEGPFLTCTSIDSEEEPRGLTEHVEREREKKKEREVAYYQSLREFEIHNSVESEESDSEQAQRYREFPRSTESMPIELRVLDDKESAHSLQIPMQNQLNEEGDGNESSNQQCTQSLKQNQAGRDTIVSSRIKRVRSEVALSRDNNNSQSLMLESTADKLGDTESDKGLKYRSVKFHQQNHKVNKQAPHLTVETLDCESKSKSRTSKPGSKVKEISQDENPEYRNFEVSKGSCQSSFTFLSKDP